MQETRVQSLGQEDPLAQEMETTPIFLPGKLREQSLEDYSLWGHKELDRTELLSTRFITGMYEGHAVKQKGKRHRLSGGIHAKAFFCSFPPRRDHTEPRLHSATHVPCFA